jgi:hypothetical protein
MASNNSIRTKHPPIDAAIPYPMGENPQRDAWYTVFFIENHLDYFTHPEQAATPEQIRFMVYTDGDERYYPCSDQMFAAIINRNRSAYLQKKYQTALKKILTLIEEQIEDGLERNYLEALIRIKYQHEIRDEIMIPARLEKRLMRIFLNRTQIEDPCFNQKAEFNCRVKDRLASEEFKAAINQIEKKDIWPYPTTLAGINVLTEQIEVNRLISLTSETELWKSIKTHSYSESDFARLFKRKLTGNGVQPLLKFLGISDPALPRRKKMILWLANEAGEVMVDLAIIKYLTMLGHKIIIAFKENPLFTKVCFNDLQEDKTLSRELESALFIPERNIAKNDLVKILRGDRAIVVISDGISENLNLMLVSATFARLFKEVDGIVSRGIDQKRRFFETHFQFTGDIFNLSTGPRGNVQISFKPKHPSAVKLSHADLENKAKAIIAQMTDAKRQGMTVIFYSGIIGSIPGKIKLAKKVMKHFIQSLKDQSTQTFFINPSEYFEQGMDADDLMYMWEIVQNSGLIDIWHFQTYDDIVKAFQLMGSRVPPEWVGKDATYSTGCTKEMRIALEVQKRHPEMQIIGPAKEKFMRRNEYGIGKMYDQRFSAMSGSEES